MKLLRTVGATSEIWQIFIQDSSSTTGAGLTGLTNASSSLTAYYHRDTDTTATAISLVTMTIGTFTSSGFKEIDSTNMPGFYQFCPPNAALASGAKSCVFMLKGATNMAPLAIEVDLDGQVDVRQWNGTNVASPATAGIPDVNAKNINNVSTSSVTTINANQGTTQPINFTGTAGSALVKSDMVDIAGSAVATSSAQIGVNVVNFGGSAGTFASGRPEVNTTHLRGTQSAGLAGYVAEDWGNVTAKTATVALTGTTIATTQQVDVNTIKTQSVTLSGGVTIPAATLASTTNITSATGVDVTKTLGTTLHSQPGYVPLDYANITGNGTTQVFDATTVGTITTYTGNTKQTGDAYDRLGAPAGASVSADVAAVKSDSGAIKTQTDKMTFTVANQIDANVLDWKSATAPAMTGDAYARLGAPAGASVSADVAAVKTDTAAIKAKTDNLPSDPADESLIIAATDALAALINALNNISTADVKTQVVAALNTDTYAEPGQGAPAATATLVAKIGYLFKAWRNKHTQTATEFDLYADDGTTVDQKATVSDDGTTFTRGELASGP